MNARHVSALMGAALVSVASAACGDAWAQPFQGPYIGGGVGYNLPEDIGLRSTAATSPRAHLGTEGGIVGLGSVGYGFGNGLRLELEGNIRNTGIAKSAGSGTLRTYGVMGNALFDMDVGSPWIYPYVGVGAGYAWTNANSVVLGTAAAGSTSTGTQGRPAVQAIAGLSFPMPGVPGLSVTSEYRFFGALGQESFQSTVTPGPTTSSLRLQNQYNHSFLLGVRYAFGVTPPAVVASAPAATPAPVVAAARSFLVFFDWDKAALTDRARAIVKEAAEASTRARTTRIEVSGYTDASGTAQYNQGLSMRRAEAVAMELVKDGVPKSAIVIQGYGQTKPLVPTAPGVREPQNRRVEIILK